MHLAYDFGGGGGARHGADGPDATGVHFGVGRNSVPQVEPAETRCPFRIEEVALIPDSGGPGRWRGGLGTRTVFRLLADTHVTTRGDRLVHPPPGRSGGRAGRCGGFYRLHADGAAERLAGKLNNVPFRAGEAFVVETTGGGGVGDPRDRPRAAVRADAAARKVTAAGAARDYGTDV
ncbi:hydantoinase B/oxoprolinase family protein [Actinomadura atramentaria]|uniref:hydantoinase B/oxoprolinase family protein n=1 Tax=Actinomadura atramentaria TaxID=1990 RepID=UPI001F0ABF32|nr:hydantoinase B/oxoprolinase family protein [Actinomadura atramentaria]